MIYKPLEELKNLKNAIFLAGACPRKKNEADWREEMITELEAAGFKVGS